MEIKTLDELIEKMKSNESIKMISVTGMINDKFNRLKECRDAYDNGKMENIEFYKEAYSIYKFFDGFLWALLAVDFINDKERDVMQKEVFNMSHPHV